MGFYGNITNTSNTTFVFDKIYPNRLSMDANVNNDGIFIGRYVLVEYQNTAAYPVVYIKGSKFYSSPNCEAVTQIKFLTGTRADNTDVDKDGYFDGVYENEIVQNYVNLKQNGNNITFDRIEYYKCTGGVGGFATFEPTTPANQSDYIKNFGIDEMHYSNEKSFKGYDSTVWTKASVESAGRLITKYVQIADLNSVVPTFDIAADAPTMEPITPHFDADSTNVYYKLHAQAPFGFRVKEESDENRSDVETTHYTTIYNKQDNTMNTSIGQSVNASIYYNQKGFDPKAKNSHVKDNNKQELPNYIKIEPTGKSSNYNNYSHQVSNYYKEIGTIKKEDWKQNTYYYLSNNEFKLSASWSNITYYVKEEVGDIQEFSLHLPAIGNMMSDAWDIIHGPNRDNDMRQYKTDENGNWLDKDGKITTDPNKVVRVDSLQGRLNSIAELKKHQIPIKQTNGALVGTTINGNKNSNITDNFEASIIKDNFETDDAWIKTQINADKTPNAISIHHTFNSTANSLSQVDKNDKTKNQSGETYKEDYLKNKTNVIEEHQDKIKLYTPYVDAAGHVVGENIETVTLPYGYKTFTTQGLAPLDNKDRENVKDLYTTINNQTDGNNTSSSSASGSRSVADNTQDSIAIEPYNKWIQTQLSDDKLVIAHEIHAINTEKSSTDLNDLKDNKIQNEINIPDWDYDAAGHIKKKGEHTYTLPYGYKTIKVENSDSVLGAPFHTGEAKETATNTQDDLKFTASNRWIKMMPTGENDIEFGHILSPIAPEDERIKLNSILHNSTDTNISEFGGSFNILNFTTDNAGHIIAVGQDIITIPQGKYEKDTPNTDSASLIVGMKLDGPTGEITTSSATTNTLQLSNYTYIGNGTKDTQTVANGQSINTALGTLEKRINDLDYADPDANTTQFVSKITENEGIINVERANVGGLVLTGYTTSGKGSGEVGETDTVNSAFAKIENKINTFLKAADTSTNAIDTLKELQTYIEEHDVEATNIIKSINDEVTRATNAENANTSLINQEVSRAQNKENEIVNNLNNEISRAIEEEGKLNTRIDNLVGNTKVSTQIDNKINTFNSTLGSAAYTESTAYATAAQGATADRIATTIDATDIVDYQAEDFVSKEEYNALLEDYNELKDLVDKLNKQLNPDPETPVEGE